MHIDKQMNIKSCKMDIPYYITFSARYGVNLYPFSEIPVGTLSLNSQVWKKCYYSDIRTLDQLLSKSPEQLVTTYGFNLEYLLEVEKCLAKFMSSWTDSFRIRNNSKTEQQDFVKENKFVDSDLQIHEQLAVSEEQEQNYAQIYLLTPGAYHSENITAQFISQYTKRFLVENGVHSVEDLLCKTPSEIAAMDGVSRTNIQNIERFLGWLKDFSTTASKEKQQKENQKLDSVDSERSLEDLLHEEQPSFPFLARRATWKRNDLLFAVTHVSQKTAYGYWITNGAIDKNTTYPLNKRNLAWEYIQPSNPQYVKEFELIRVHADSGNNQKKVCVEQEKLVSENGIVSMGDKNSYVSWLTQKVSADSLDDLLSAYEIIEKYAVNNGFISKNFFEITNINTAYVLQDAIKQKKEFRKLDINTRYFCGLAIRHYLSYLSESEAPVEKNAPSGNEVSDIYDVVYQQQRKIAEERKHQKKIIAEHQEAERREQERQEAERREQERQEAERREQERQEAERREQERQEAERREQERQEAERREQERQEAERREQERQEAERREQERQEAERREQERQEAERREQERHEAERREQERQEAERREQERQEAERREQERQEAERREQERQEAERREQERQEAECREQERQEAELREREHLEAELREWDSSGVRAKYDSCIACTLAENQVNTETAQEAEKQSITSIDCFEADKTLAELYDLLPAQFHNMEFQYLELSVRLSNVCRRNEMFTVADLLNKTPAQLMEMKNFGKTCMQEIQRLIEGILSGKIYAETNLKDVAQMKSTSGHYLISAYVPQIALGDFSFLEEETLPEEIRRGVSPYLEVYDLLGDELAANCINDSEKVVPLISVLAEFGKLAQQHHMLHQYLEKIPEERWETKAATYIKVYGKHEYLLYKLYPEENAVLKDILQRDSLSEEQMELAVKFLSWCAFDLSQDVEHLLTSAYKGGSGKLDERRKEVVFLRAQKQTLEQIGQKFGVTRERVRQIEGKAVRFFEKQQSRIKLISKINAVKNGSSVVTPADLAEYAGENLQELIFLLKSCKTAKYIYDKDMDLFIVGNDALQDRIQEFTEHLPEQIPEKDLPAIYSLAEEDYELTAEVVDKAIEDVYKKTGSIYHRSRLIRREIYAEILKEYYPNGLHVYDPKEIRRFREIIAERYGDIKLSEGDRALAARITDICVLCGKGTYRLKQKQYIPKRLAEKICRFIDDSDYAIFMTNTIFDEFKTELLAAGVDNKYYLQGILHELFEDRYTFTRDYISKDPKITSVYSTVVNYIRKSRYPVSKQMIQKEFPGVNEISLNIAVSDPEILNYFGEYLHASYLKISEQEQAYLHSLMEEMLSDGEVHHPRWLYERIMKERPEILTRNGAMQPFHTFSVMEYLFREEYEFQRPYIAPLGMEIESLAKRLHDFIYTKEEIKVSQIRDFIQESRSFISSMLDFINSCNDRYLMVDSDTMLTIEKTGVDESVARKLEELILPEVHSTMMIRELTCWNRFPVIRVPWTEWLVYSILNKWSEKLEVEPSNNQLRLAVPLVGPVGKLNPVPFADTYKVAEYHSNDFVPTVADDLEQIDDLLTDLLGDELLEDGLWD